MDHVFISYAHADRAAAIRLEEDLRFRGVRTWIHLRDIVPGTYWSAELEKALADARLLVVLLSPHVAESEWVEREYTYALQRGTRVIPALLATCDIPSDLRAIQHLELRDYERGLAELLELIPRDLVNQELTAQNLGTFLKSDNPRTRCETLNRIALNRLHEMLEPVSDLMLTDSSEEVRAAAAFAIDRINQPAAIDPLIRAIHDPSGTVRSNAGWALVHLGKPAAAEVRKLLSETTNVEAREMAALILARL